MNEYLCAFIGFSVGIELKANGVMIAEAFAQYRFPTKAVICRYQQNCDAATYSERKLS